MNTNSDLGPNLVYTLTKYELDDAHKDKQHKIYPSEFEVIFHLIH